MVQVCRECPSEGGEGEGVQEGGGVKRQLGNEGEGEGEGEMEVVEGEGNKRPREEERAPETGGERRGEKPDLNFPLPNETGLPCLLKVSGCPNCQ